MKLTKKLAYSQLRVNRSRSIWALVGIIISVGMITAVYGSVASFTAAITSGYGGIDIPPYEGISEIYAMFFGMGTVLSLIIAAVAIIVVSNVFRISAGERIMQFGVLKSAGATKRQITETVVYECLFLSAIGIPAGIALGFLIQLILVRFANYMFHDWNQTIQSGMDLLWEFRFTVSLPVIGASIALSLGTMLISAWLPARKAAKITAIDAIRGVGEVKISTKRLRTNRLVQKLFGFEGVLAAKSIKRKKRSFRAAVISLTVSVTLFVAAGSFGSQMTKFVDMMFPFIDSEIIAQYYTSFHYVVCEHGEFSDLLYTPILAGDANEITALLRDYPAQIYGVGTNTAYQAFVPDDMITPGMLSQLYYLGPDDYNEENGGFKFYLTLMSLCESDYADLCRQAGVPLGSNILLNYQRDRINGRLSEYSPFHFANQTLRVEGINTSYDLPLHGQLDTDIPNEIMFASLGLVVIVPELDADNYTWFVKTDDVDGFLEFARDTVPAMVPESSNVRTFIEIYSIEESMAAVRNAYQLMMVLIYVFVGLLTLIGLTNVISTISANVRSRSREFAVLQSAGLTFRGLNRMLNLESILSSFKSLIFGIPLGIAASYVIHLAMLRGVGVRYNFPWLSIIQCVIGVFAITWITMRYSASRIRGKNIIETIRLERN